jgi:hypothetical protein
LGVEFAAFGQRNPAAKVLESQRQHQEDTGAGQTAAQQSHDETECYNWAVQHTGNDPFQLAKQVAQQQ